MEWSSFRSYVKQTLIFRNSWLPLSHFFTETWVLESGTFLASFYDSNSNSYETPAILKFFRLKLLPNSLHDFPAKAYLTLVENPQDTSQEGENVA
jgi:hypothetical protein